MHLSEISDRPVRRINMASLERLFTDDLKRLIAAMEFYGFKLRIVGGAVRDVLIGKAPRDIDLITDALPDETMYVLEKHKFPYVTKGIPHGTVKVVFSAQEEYEITSLAYEIEDECCPDKIVIHSSQSWEGDAKRRDFTIDTMSVDFNGHLYDYVGGIKDLRDHQVKFIGEPSARIQKDPVLILRFFKLLSMFKNPKFDKAVIPVLRDNMKLIKKLKPKRLAVELSNIAKGINAERVQKMMQNLGIDEYIGNGADVVEAFCEVIYQEQTRMLLEASPEYIVPALKILHSNGRMEIVPGERGEMHAMIFDRLDPDTVTGAEQVDSGFYDTRNRQYLTRREALALVGAGDSTTLRRRQGIGGRVH